MQHSNTDQIDHAALTAELRARGYHLLTPLADGQTQPLAPAGWIRRDASQISYGDGNQTYHHATGGVVR